MAGERFESCRQSVNASIDPPSRRMRKDQRATCRISHAIPSEVIRSFTNHPISLTVSERRPMPAACFFPVTLNPPEQYGGSVTTASTFPSVGRISRQSPRYRVASPICSHRMCHRPSTLSTYHADGPLSITPCLPWRCAAIASSTHPRAASLSMRFCPARTEDKSGSRGSKSPYLR